jgi:hypothetical protein
MHQNAYSKKSFHESNILRIQQLLVVVFILLQLTDYRAGKKRQRRVEFESLITNISLILITYFS